MTLAVEQDIKLFNGEINNREGRLAVYYDL